MVRKRRGATVAAAVDIGSYSVHLLVAEIHEHELLERHDESAFLGLGREIDVAARLGEGRERLVETLSRFADRARDLGAATITVVGTDPLRRAIDAPEAIGQIRASAGLEVAILDHEEEALIALIGVQAGRPIAHDTVVVDVGGGSTEIIAVGPRREAVAVGLQLGATRLTGAHIEHDPPLWREIRAVMEETAERMVAAPPIGAADLIAVGGTARSLLRVGPRLANRALTKRRIVRALDLIAASPAEAISNTWGVRLSRARVLAAGAAILVGALDHYGLDRLRVAKGGLREGLILAAHRGGPGWRGRIRELALGWER